MARRLFILLLSVAAGTILVRCSGGPASKEELKVKALERGYLAATNSFLRAVRTMGGVGLDTTSDVESAVEDIKKIRSELAQLLKNLTEEKSAVKAEELRAKIDEFCRRNDIE